MLKNGNKRAHGGARKGAGRKTEFATILKQKFIEEKEGEAEKAFAYLCAVRDNNSAPEQWRCIASEKIMDRVWGKSKERIEFNWREKAKERGYDPDSILQQVATAIAERNFGGGDSGGTRENSTEEHANTE